MTGQAYAGPPASRSNDLIVKGELDAAIAAIGGAVIVTWSGTAWPSRASSIPVGYVGPVEFHSETDAGAPAPTDFDELLGDIWYTAVPAATVDYSRVIAFSIVL
jgi:hypothetical protein